MKTGVEKRPTKKQLKASAFRSKKRTRHSIGSTRQTDEPLSLPEEDQDNPSPQRSGTPPRKKKKSRQDPDHENGRKAYAQQGASNGEPGGAVMGAAAKRRKRKKLAKLKEISGEGAAQKRSRLILFVGNLPFDIDPERLRTFFVEKCDEAPQVRLMTRKSDSKSSQEPKSMGCGFVEFLSSAALQKALRLHHTLITSALDPNLSTASKPRKINIELTAGGGGNSESRQRKIEQSKQRLTRQREKKVEKTIKAAAEKNSAACSTDHQQDVTITHGSKRKRKGNDDVAHEGREASSGRAEWGAKAPSKKDTRILRSSMPSSNRTWRPQMSGANAIKLG